MSLLALIFRIGCKTPKKSYFILYAYKIRAKSLMLYSTQYTVCNVHTKHTRIFSTMKSRTINI